MSTPLGKYRGVIHGNTVVLENSPGLKDGETVEVVLGAALPPGEGLRRAAGSWAEGGEELDRFVEETYRHRSVDRSVILP